MAVYLMFYFISTFITAFFAGLILSSMAEFPAGLITLVIAFGAAIYTVLPACFTSAPVWAIIRFIGRRMKWSEKQSAKLASIPTLWIGVLTAQWVTIGNMAPEANYFTVNSFTFYVLGVATIVGPFIAGKIYG